MHFYKDTPLVRDSVKQAKSCHHKSSTITTRPLDVARPISRSFPAPHVAFRLEQIAAGLWPTPPAGTPAPPPASDHAAGSSSGVVAHAVLAACRGSLPSAQRCYELVLSRRAGSLVPGAEAAPVRLRTAMLRSLCVLCRAAASELGSSVIGPGLGGVSVVGGQQGAGVQREVGGLMDACERYALEARRMGVEGLAGEFDELRQGLAGVML